MRSSERRLKIAEELGYFDEYGNLDYRSFMQADIDWQAHIDAGTYTKEELQLAALMPPDFKPTQVFVQPATDPAEVPIDIEAFEDLGDGTYRLQFLTIADDGYPTRFDEEVEPEGDVAEWLTSFLQEQQIRRANANAAKKAKKLDSGPPKRQGQHNESVAALVDSLFPTVP